MFGDITLGCQTMCSLLKIRNYIFWYKNKILNIISFKNCIVNQENEIADENF